MLFRSKDKIRELYIIREEYNKKCSEIYQLFSNKDTGYYKNIIDDVGVAIRRRNEFTAKYFSKEFLELREKEIERIKNEVDLSGGELFIAFYKNRNVKTKRSKN